VVFEVTRQGIHLGPLHIAFYGVMTLAGCFAGAILTHFEFKRRGENPEHGWNIMALGVVLGLIGARLYHVIHQWSYYSTHLTEIPAIWHGGQGIFGAIAGALLALILYVRWRRLNLAVYADIGVIGFLLGQAVGRWGNFFNQEIYGPPTELPWGLYIDATHRLPGYELYEHFHPLFLYESLTSLAGVLTLLWISRRFASKLKSGDVALMYGIWYPTERFFLEFLRIDDPWKIAGINTAQWVSGAIILVCAIALILRDRRSRIPAQIASVPEPLTSQPAIPPAEQTVIPPPKPFGPAAQQGDSPSAKKDDGEVSQ
jgi:phosphatidylglycerol:prolipoprotein diacylglycerol transferase